MSLYYCSPGDINSDGHVDLLDLPLLTHDWLKQQGGLSTDLNSDAKVNFSDYGILGENWRSSARTLIQRQTLLIHLNILLKYRL